MKSLFVVLFASLFLLLNSSFVLGFDVPNFPACSNPEGKLIASYDSGTHGVVGGNSYSGNDKVYRISDIALVQCLCTTDGKGIQTNWWKASSLSDEEINILKNDNWIYIPTGSVWGLDASSYVAKNIQYSCLSNGTGGGSSSSVGQVLGLAFTGNILLILTVFVIGVLSLIYGQILHRTRD